MNQSRQSIMTVQLVVLLIFCAGCFLHYQRGYFYTGLTSLHAQGADDAYISYRYGWNLAQYGTLSWNESGYRRTEGFTNPLWVYLSAFWALLGNKDWIYPLMVITSTILTVIFLLFLNHHIYRANENHKAALIAIILVAATPAIWLYVTSGLESGVFGLSLALLAYLAIFTPKGAQIQLVIVLLSILVGLLRSDGFIYLLIILIGALIAGSQNWKPVCLGLLISGACLFAWRWLEFGKWLPNTAIAKVNFGFKERVRVGSVFLLLAMLNSGLFTVVILGLAGVMLQSLRFCLAGVWIFFAWLAYYVLIGGDIYFERHLVGLFFLAAAMSAPLWYRSKPLPRILMIAAVVVGIILSVQRDMGRFDYSVKKLNDPLVMLGKAIDQDRERYGVIISPPAGKIPFFAGGDCLDPYGLNDPYLATIERSEFTPGHSAGSEKAALEITREHPLGIYTTFSHFDSSIISGPQDISLWINNRHPQDEVQYGATEAEWQAALASGDPYLWSIISVPVRVESHIP